MVDFGGAAMFHVKHFKWNMLDWWGRSFQGEVETSKGLALASRPPPPPPPQRERGAGTGPARARFQGARGAVVYHFC
jgi:hypothetical protein